MLSVSWARGFLQVWKVLQYMLCLTVWQDKRHVESAQNMFLKSEWFVIWWLWNKFSPSNWCEGERWWVLKLNVPELNLWGQYAQYGELEGRSTNSLLFQKGPLLWKVPAAMKGPSCFLCETECLTTAPFSTSAPCLILIHWGKMKQLFNDLAQGAIQVGNVSGVVICWSLQNLKNCEGYRKRSSVSRAGMRQDDYSMGKIIICALWLIRIF